MHNYEGRLAAGLPVNPVLMHCAGLLAVDKQAAYERLGLFHGNFNRTHSDVPIKGLIFSTQPPRVALAILVTFSVGAALTYYSTSVFSISRHLNTCKGAFKSRL